MLLTFLNRSDLTDGLDVTLDDPLLLTKTFPPRTRTGRGARAAVAFRKSRDRDKLEPGST
jgi:hypothetical protein